MSGFADAKRTGFRAANPVNQHGKIMGLDFKQHSKPQAIFYRAAGVGGARAFSSTSLGVAGQATWLAEIGSERVSWVDRQSRSDETKLSGDTRQIHRVQVPERLVFANNYSVVLSSPELSGHLDTSRLVTTRGGAALVLGPPSLAEA